MVEYPTFHFESEGVFYSSVTASAGTCRDLESRKWHDLGPEPQTLAKGAALRSGVCAQWRARNLEVIMELLCLQRQHTGKSWTHFEAHSGSCLALWLGAMASLVCFQVLLPW